jgi:photosystem II stability/assembly factor-like uncharacterized protein
VNGDTIAAGGDSSVYVSIDAGSTWKGSATVTANGFDVERVRMRNRRLYAGTRRAGVFVSDDVGDTWSDFNQGLVGGIGNSQLDIIDMLIRGDSLYVATEGGGAWVRNLTAGTWQPYGNEFAPDQATNMTLIAAGGSRLFAAGGFNGTVFFRDPGDPDWTLSLLFNDRFAAGLAALSAVWTGTRWVVGSNIGIFYSALGESPWTFSDPGAGRPLFTVPIAMAGHDLIANFGAFSSTISVSHDDGGTWQTLEILPMPVTGLAVVGNTIYASRTDGLWRRPIADLVSVGGSSAPSRLTFAIAGSQPIGERVRFAFELPESGPIAIEVFDLAGRRVGNAIRENRQAGHGESEWDARRLAPGVYNARLTAPGGRAVARLIRL